MWANEDGIPLLGSFAHLNEYHTDPTYENLVLSLASGAIGNSEMPVIDIYGGPLGWIPIFNPSHVKGHNTDYVTLLTSCGGIGIPLNSNDLTALNVPSVEELADLSDLIIPGLPDPEMLTDPNYLWETTDASAILNRVTPEALTNTEEYLGFANDHFDTWRLLWETALNDVASGNPSGVLEVLQITENINTLESLAGIVGEDAVAGALGGETLTNVVGENPLTGVGKLDQVLENAELNELLQTEALDPVTDALGSDVLGSVTDTVGGVTGDDSGGLLGGLTGGSDGDSGGLLGGLTGGSDGGLGGVTDTVGGLTGGLTGGDSGGLLGGGALTGLLEDGLSSGLLGGLTGGTDGGAATTTEYSVLLSGAGADANAAAQCQGTLVNSSFTVSCVYAGTASEVQEVSIDAGGKTFILDSNGGTSGGAVGSFTLTPEEIKALNSGEFTLNITTASATNALSGTVKPC
ncbi:hypothetical protein GCM10027591_05700 [Zhihengliuella somnathii]